MGVRIERVSDEAGRAAAWQVRLEVFVAEQCVPEDLERDDRDASATHWIAVDDGAGDGGGASADPAAGEVVGTVRMLVEHGTVAHLGRLAVRKSARGAGVGSLLVRAVEDEARARGLSCVLLGAQVQAIPFYQRLGYAVVGDEFDDAGIPHREMRRAL